QYCVRMLQFPVGFPATSSAHNVGLLGSAAAYFSGNAQMRDVLREYPKESISLSSELLVRGSSGSLPNVSFLLPQPPTRFLIFASDLFVYLRRRSWYSCWRRCGPGWDCSWRGC